MTKQQAEAAVNLLSTKYPDAMVEPSEKLEDDAAAGADDAGDYSVAVGGTIEDQLDEIIGQVKEDFGDDPEAENIIAELERLQQPAIELALEEQS